MKPSESGMSRRERQIMDVLHRRGEATAAEVMADMAQPPSYSAVRAALSVLEGKGRIAHGVKGRTYVYRPTTSPSVARRAALRHVVATFFDGSVGEAAAALLDLAGRGLDESERRRLSRRIAEAQKEGR